MWTWICQVWGASKTSKCRCSVNTLAMWMRHSRQLWPRKVTEVPLAEHRAREGGLIARVTGLRHVRAGRGRWASRGATPRVLYTGNQGKKLASAVKVRGTHVMWPHNSTPGGLRGAALTHVHQGRRWRTLMAALFTITKLEAVGIRRANL